MSVRRTLYSMPMSTYNDEFCDPLCEALGTCVANVADHLSWEDKIFLADLIEDSQAEAYSRGAREALDATSLAPGADELVEKDFNDFSLAVAEGDVCDCEICRAFPYQPEVEPTEDPLVEFVLELDYDLDTVFEATGILTDWASEMMNEHNALVEKLNKWAPETDSLITDVTTALKNTLSAVEGLAEIAQQQNQRIYDLEQEAEANAIWIDAVDSRLALLEINMQAKEDEQYVG